MVVHEPQSQPVEEFRMRGCGALRTEVFERFDNAKAEDLLPEAVDGGACSQGVVFAEQPSGETQTVVRRTVREWIQRLRYTRVDRFGMNEPVAAFEDVGSAALFLIVFNHDRRLLNIGVQQFHEGLVDRGILRVVFSGKVATESEPIDGADRFVSGDRRVEKQEVQVVYAVNLFEGKCNSFARTAFLDVAAAEHGTIQ